MADNTTRKDATGTTVTMASDDVSGVQYTRVKPQVGADGAAADVSDTNPFPVQNPPIAETTGTITASAQSVTHAVPRGDNTAAIELSGTFTGTSNLIVEVAFDGGTTYYNTVINPTYSQNPSLQSPANITPGFFSLGLRLWSVNVAGATHVRARCTAFQSGDSIGVRIRSFQLPLVSLVQNVPTVGSLGVGAAASAPPVYVGGNDGTSSPLIRALALSTKGAAPSGTPYYLAIQKAQDAGRTAVVYYATAAAAGTTTTETAITLTKSSGTSATSTGTSFVVTSGKRFRIAQLTVATRGHATATIQTTTFSLRINTAGAVTTTSTPVALQVRSATPATASAWDRAFFDLGGDGYEILGDGTLQFGVTAAATYTTNAPTWDVTIIGYEY